jgi:quercetin dioxygenase-like cupin family protein
MDKPFIVANHIAYQEGSVVSREISKGSGGTITLFAFDAGQGLSEHKTPFDAFAHVVDGEAEITVGGTKYTVKAGEMIHMPANVPHALQAVSRFKMMLVMMRKT